MTVTVACPSCGAPVPFRSVASVYAVCAYCQSMVVRTDTNVAAIGQMASLPDDMSPLQPGTELSLFDTRYTVAGRARMAWEDGGWNEWFLVAGGATAWLAEAQGFFAGSIESPRMQWQHALAGAPALGTVLTLDGRTYRVTDIKQATCVGSQGELPYRAPRGRSATYYDMLGETGGFAGLENGDDGWRLFIGRYVAFDDLGCTGLRPLDGWSPPAAPMSPALDPFLTPP